MMETGVEKPGAPHTMADEHAVVPATKTQALLALRSMQARVPWTVPDVVLVSAPEAAVKQLKPDVRLDARCLKNPWNVPALNPLWGLDRRVVNYVKQDEKLEGLIAGVPADLERLWEASTSSVPLLVISTCRGGWHRSPALNVILAERLVQKGFHVQIRTFRPEIVTMECQSEGLLISQSKLHAVLGMTREAALRLADMLCVCPNTGWPRKEEPHGTVIEC